MKTFSQLLVLGFGLMQPWSGFCQQTNQVNVRAWGALTWVPPDLTNAIAISAGGCALALRSDRRVTAWNQSGLLPVPAGLTNVAAIASGGWQNLAVTIEGSVVAWGNDGSAHDNVPPGVNGVVAVAVGGSHSLALRGDGTVIIWGLNADFSTRLVGVPASATNVIAIAAGGPSSAALTKDGLVVGWDAACPTGCIVVSTGATALACWAMEFMDGPEHLFLAVMRDSTTAGWGAFAGLTNVQSVSMNGHALALTRSGAVFASGLCMWGACDVPLDLPFATAIAAGSGFSLALVDPAHAGSPPTILIHPQPRSQTRAIGSSTAFTVKATGFPELRYQWHLGTTKLAGATNAMLTLPNIQSEQSGAYTVVVSNDAGSVTSNPAILSVLPALAVDMVPAISLIGQVGFAYRLEYVNPLGPTNDWHSLATLTLTNNPQFYFDVSAIGQPRRFYRLVQVP